MSIAKLSSKTPDEIVAVTFDFSNTVDTITSVSSIAISLYSGVTDSGMSAMLDSQGGVISGTTVAQLVKNGLDGNIYKLTCEIISTSEKYALSCLLPIYVYN
jgi:hypothetical protein